MVKRKLFKYIRKKLLLWYNIWFYIKKHIKILVLIMLDKYYFLLILWQKTAFYIGENVTPTIKLKYFLNLAIKKKYSFVNRNIFQRIKSSFSIILTWHEVIKPLISKCPHLFQINLLLFTDKKPVLQHDKNK